ncbi:Protein transport protein Sec24-like [Acorus gramineus]|uniref:Protein transport protein Sec24-like n=1 Tax=Acorus gramineus TaxID=55184 RepID=A0AAV9A6F8_ACOGR|nr:Protein transport protein Sec24-like [Acorus gramineus]
MQRPPTNEKPGPPSVLGRPVSPFVAPPQPRTPFSSTGLVAGPPGGPVYGGPPPVRYNGPFAAPPPSSSPPIPNAGIAQLVPPVPGPQPIRFSGPSSPPPPQSAYPAQPPQRGPPPTGPPTLSPPMSLRPNQPQTPFVPMGPPPQSASPMPPRGIMPPPPVESSFPTPSATFQQPFPGYHSRPAGQVTSIAPPPPPPPMHAPPFHAQQGSYMPPPPIAAPLGFNSREQLQYPSAGPPVGSAGNLQGLVEDFQSLSVGSVPGSLDPGLDVNSLPRPLDVDEKPSSLTEMYPMNCPPRYFRLTTHAIPNSQSLLSRWHLPLGAVVHPLAEAPDGEEVPIVNFGSAGIIRCKRCRTYINPYVTFTDGGRKWRCIICSLLNDVPGDYFSLLDASGRRCDINDRPELLKGSVEFVAPTEYMVRPPMPPLYFFLIDVSINAVKSGMLEIVANAIKSCLDELPGFPRTQIGFITFDSTLHFYNMKSSLTQPQMMVVADLDDIFIPLPDDLLVNLSESRNVVDAFLDSLPSMFQDNVNLESAFGPALRAAYMVMSQLGGKLLIFQSTLPSLGIGRLKLRGDDIRVYGTEKEHLLRIPEDPFYKQMAADFTKYQIAVDIFAFSDKYSDMASLGTLAKYTGGQVYHYPAFQGHIHGEKLRYELVRDLTRETAWEAVMRIRCGKGVRFTSYHGHAMLRSTDLMALPAVDCDKGFAVQMALEETLLTTQTIYFQVALLYTSSSGERRIRILTSAAPVVADLGEMYRQADAGATVCLLSKLAVEKTLLQKLEDARHSVQLRIVKSLREYRNLHAVQHRLVGRLIYPESLKYLALYGLALCKSLPLRGGYADVQLDERCAAGYNMIILPIKGLVKLLYPSLIRVDESLAKVSNDGDSMKRLPLTAACLDPKGLYIYDDGFKFVLWLGNMLSPDMVVDLLGVDLSSFPDLSRVTIIGRDNEASRKLTRILRKLSESNPSFHQCCHIVRQGEQPRESILLLNNLIEDQNSGVSGYLDWVLHIHRQVQQNV